MTVNYHAAAWAPPLLARPVTGLVEASRGPWARTTVTWPPLKKPAVDVVSSPDPEADSQVADDTTSLTTDTGASSSATKNPGPIDDDSCSATRTSSRHLPWLFLASLAIVAVVLHRRNRVIR